MARGAEAKANFIKRLSTALGADYIGEVDKKFYVWSTENGERIQLALALTCPKTSVTIQGNGGDLNFENDDVPITPVSRKVEMDAEEKATLERLMKELDL